MTTTNRRLAALALVSVAMWPLTVPTAHADDPPGSAGSASPPPAIDANAPGLMLPDGATLAPAKVLDIKQIVEEEGGAERRQDTNVDVTFALQAEVLFPKNSAKLSPAASSRIAAIAAEVNKLGSGRVRVFGFTDNLGTYEHGLKLSKQRAVAVQQVLARALDPGTAFDVRGYSEDYPIADNATEEGRKKNRRVEVSFPRTTAPAPAPAP
ncbi:MULTISPECIES: OmpA family protein [unclassified Streptomyces]|uniref:OmpA family protein n=2 Tax=unclassified Streptomyces TaxID=2593676 RepID=UPI000F77FBF7|nr:OmpA family protein [Streptomyces sp. WAC01280]RSS55278.1 OmpA family protein [Streptomyces sp. WAC01280]